MSNVINGTFTIQQMLENTYTSKFRTRFEYKTRDVLKKVVLIKETTLHPDRPDSPAELNGDTLIERGKELLEEVYGKWKSFTYPVIMRG